MVHKAWIVCKIHVKSMNVLLPCTVAVLQQISCVSSDTIVTDAKIEKKTILFNLHVC